MGGNGTIPREGTYLFKGPMPEDFRAYTINEAAKSIAALEIFLKQYEVNPRICAEFHLKEAESALWAINWHLKDFEKPGADMLFCAECTQKHFLESQKFSDMAAPASGAHREAVSSFSEWARQAADRIRMAARSKDLGIVRLIFDESARWRGELRKVRMAEVVCGADSPSARELLEDFLLEVQKFAEEGVGFFPSKRSWWQELSTWARATSLALRDVDAIDVASVSAKARGYRKALIEMAEALFDETGAPVICEGCTRSAPLDDAFRNLLEHQWVRAFGSPGLEIFPDRAKKHGCRCFLFKDRRICYAKGIRGPLDDSQKKKFCSDEKTVEVPFTKMPPKMRKRFAIMEKAAPKCHARMGDLTGLARAQAFMDCMRVEAADSETKADLKAVLACEKASDKSKLKGEARVKAMLACIMKAGIIDDEPGREERKAFKECYLAIKKDAMPNERAKLVLECVEKAT
jgi:hypothetical protein